MNPFEIATEDIFSNPDFLDTAIIAGNEVPVIASEITEDEQLTEFGLDDGVNFFLRVERRLLTVPPKKNMLLSFKGNEYRVAKASLDSAGLVWKIDLQSKSSR